MKKNTIIVRTHAESADVKGKLPGAIIALVCIGGAITALYFLFSRFGTIGALEKDIFVPLICSYIAIFGFCTLYRLFFYEDFEQATLISKKKTYLKNGKEATALTFQRPNSADAEEYVENFKDSDEEHAVIARIAQEGNRERVYTCYTNENCRELVVDNTYTIGVKSGNAVTSVRKEGLTKPNWGMLTIYISVFYVPLYIFAICILGFFMHPEYRVIYCFVGIGQLVTIYTLSKKLFAGK